MVPHPRSFLLVFLLWSIIDMDWILWFFVAGFLSLWLLMFVFAALILMAAREGYEDHNGFHYGTPPENNKDSF